jgi:hypothetical protein
MFCSLLHWRNETTHCGAVQEQHEVQGLQVLRENRKLPFWCGLLLRALQSGRVNEKENKLMQRDQNEVEGGGEENKAQKSVK